MADGAEEQSEAEQRRQQRIQRRRKVGSGIERIETPIMATRWDPQYVFQSSGWVRRVYSPCHRIEYAENTQK